MSEKNRFSMSIAMNISWWILHNILHCETCIGRYDLGDASVLYQFVLNIKDTK